MAEPARKPLPQWLFPQFPPPLRRLLFVNCSSGRRWI